MKFSKKIIIGILSFAFVFICVMFYSFMKTGYEQSSLIYAVFALITGEMWALAYVKNSDNVNEVETLKIEEDCIDDGDKLETETFK